eukprot:8194415-Pyramimonas_sp.AAC.2
MSLVPIFCLITVKGDSSDLLFVYTIGVLTGTAARCGVCDRRSTRRTARHSQAPADIVQWDGKPTSERTKGLLAYPAFRLRGERYAVGERVREEETRINMFNRN